MPQRSYLFRIALLVVFAIVSLILSTLVFTMFLPIMITFFQSAAIILGIFVVLFMLVYSAMILAAAIYYLLKSMEFAEERKETAVAKLKKK